MGFSEILNAISEETDREQFAIMAAKYPSLREYTEAGERFNSLKPRIAAALGNKFNGDIETPVKYVEDWKRWEVDNWDNDASMTRQEKLKQQALDAAHERIQELEARSETDMTPDEIRALAREVASEVIKNNGVITAAELDAKIDKELAPRFSQQLNGALVGFESVMKDLSPKLTEHARLYGEDMDAGKVFSYMSDQAEKGNRMTAKQAYEAVYADKISARQAEAVQKQREADRAEGAAEERKRLATEGRPGAMPVGNGDSRRMGTMQRRAMERVQKSASGTIEAPLGRGVIAAKAAADRRNQEFASAAS